MFAQVGEEEGGSVIKEGRPRENGERPAAPRCYLRKTSHGHWVLSDSCCLGSGGWGWGVVRHNKPWSVVSAVADTVLAS